MPLPLPNKTVVWEKPAQKDKREKLITHSGNVDHVEEETKKKKICLANVSFHRRPGLTCLGASTMMARGASGTASAGMRGKTPTSWTLLKRKARKELMSCSGEVYLCLTQRVCTGTIGRGHLSTIQSSQLCNQGAGTS